VIAEERVYKRRQQYLSVNYPALWLVVPRQVAFDYVPAKPYHAQMRQLIRQGRAVNPLLNPRDKGLGHSVRVRKSLATQPSKFKRFYHREQM
jgi:D-aspartate ligase